MTINLLSILFCFLGRVALAQDVGVLVVKGEALTGATGKIQTPLKVGARIADGQSVRTGPGALLILAYMDNSRIKIKENSEIVIHAGKGAKARWGIFRL